MRNCSSESTERDTFRFRESSFLHQEAEIWSSYVCSVAIANVDILYKSTMPWLA